MATNGGASQDTRNKWMWMTGSRQLSFLGRLVPQKRERNSSHQRNRRKYRETLLGRAAGMPAGISAREKTHTRTAEILANEHQVEVLLISNHWVMCRRKYALQIPQDSTRDRERERERKSRCCWMTTLGQTMLKVN